MARAIPGSTAIPWFVGAQLALIIALLTTGPPCRAALCAAAVTFGAGWFAVRVHESRPDDLAQMLSERAETRSPTLITVAGLVTDHPEPIPPRSGALGAFSPHQPGYRFPLRVDALITPDGPINASGTLIISLHSRAPPICVPGDRVRVMGTWSPIAAPANPGEPDRRMPAAQERVVGRLNIPDPSLIHKLPVSATALGAARATAVSWLGALRGRVNHALAAALDSDSADTLSVANSSPGRALLAAMLVGEREPGLDEIERAFRRLGLVHLVAISGFNLAIVAGLVLFCMRLGRNWGAFEPLIVAILISAYMLVVPGEAPILRSGIMVLAFLAAEASGRRYDRLTLLGWIAAALILYRPLDLFSLGFQLSFGIVAALMWLGERARQRLFGIDIKGLVKPRPPNLPAAALRHCLDWGKAAISTSLLAWSVAIPTIAHHTGLVSPLAAITSILVLPFVVVALWIGYVVLMIGALVPGAAHAVGGILTGVGDLLAAIVFRLDGLPGMALHVPRLSAWLAAGATILILYWFVRGHTRDRIAWGATAVVACWAGTEFFMNTRLADPGIIRVDTLALDRGECRLLRSGSAAVLWDCGSSNPGAGLRTIPRALRELGAFRVPTVVITRSDIDHFNALPDLLEPLGVREALVPATFLNDARSRPGGPAAACLRSLRNNSIKVRAVAAGEVIPLGNARLEILSPAMDQTEFGSVAEASLIGLLTADPAERRGRVLLASSSATRAVARVLGQLGGKPPEACLLPRSGTGPRMAQWLEVWPGGRINTSE